MSKQATQVFPVGVFIHEEMVERGWDGFILAANMGTSFSLAAAVVLNIGTRLSANEAQQLADAFDGTSAQFWKNLDDAWHERPLNPPPPPHNCSAGAGP